MLSKCLYDARHAGVPDAYTVEGISWWPQCPKHDVHGNVTILHVVNGIVTTWVIADLLTADCNGVSIVAEKGCAGLMYMRSLLQPI